MPDEETFSFNFWPSFADLMLSVVLILILVIFLIYSVLSAGTVNLSHVEERQRVMIASLAASFGSIPEETEKNIYVISISRSKTRDVIIRNYPTLQRFSFGSHILFPQDEYLLSENGKRVLKTLGGLLKQQLPKIKEIQIQGHADPVPTLKHGSNLKLAALRAVEVFRFFQQSVGIDPAQNLMSATSFGEYKPVQRSDDDESYNIKRLNAHNFIETQRTQNRRIELLLFYRY